MHAKVCTISRNGMLGFVIIICVSAISAGIEDPGIEISDALTLHSGDIIRLQADNGAYLYDWNQPGCGHLVAIYKLEAIKPTELAEFIVETNETETNQIRLRAKNSDHYLRYSGPGSYPPCPAIPYIRIDDASQSDSQWFTVIKLNDKQIALKTSNNYLLARFDGALGAGSSIVVATKDITTDSPYSRFAINKIGIDPDEYKQTITKLEFLESPDLTTTPELLMAAEQKNDGSGEMSATFTHQKTFTSSNKFAFERSIGLAIGSTISATLEVPGFGGGGIDVSTEVTYSDTKTTEYEEQVETTLIWSQNIQVPANTKSTLRLITDMAAINVPFTALVNVTSKDGSRYYNYPINGEYKGTHVMNLRVEKTEEPLMQAYADNQNVPTLAEATAEDLTLAANYTAETTAESSYTTYTLAPTNGTYQNMSDSDLSTQVSMRTANEN